MTCVLRIVADPTLDGKYIKDYVPDTDVRGRGRLSVTEDKNEAKQFADAGEALTFWKQQSTRCPVNAVSGRLGLPSSRSVEIEKV